MRVLSVGRTPYGHFGRHQVISHNVANVNTPNFRRLRVNFEDALKEQLAEARQTHPDKAPDLSNLQPEVYTDTNGGVIRVDGNNVDINAEMGRLNKNALLHNVYTQILANKISAMRLAINGRG